jgi:hypothetical protein
MNVPKINSPRQRRMLELLVRFGRVTNIQIREYVGALNAPELMAQLRKNGWEWTCERIEVIDRDGQHCRPGLYGLSEEHQILAAEILEIKV